LRSCWLSIHSLLIRVWFGWVSGWAEVGSFNSFFIDTSPVEDSSACTVDFQFILYWYPYSSPVSSIRTSLTFNSFFIDTRPEEGGQAPAEDVLSIHSLLIQDLTNKLKKVVEQELSIHSLLIHTVYRGIEWTWALSIHSLLIPEMLEGCSTRSWTHNFQFILYWYI